MTEPALLVTILCAQCSRSARAQRTEPLPEKWVEHVGLLSALETYRELLQSTGMLPVRRVTRPAPSRERSPMSGHRQLWPTSHSPG